MTAEEKINRFGCSCKGSETGRLAGEGVLAAGEGDWVVSCNEKETGIGAAAGRVRVSKEME